MLEVFVGVMDIQSVVVWLLFDEDEMFGVFVVDEQFIVEVEWFLLCVCDQFVVQGKYGVYCIGMDEIFGDYFQYVGICRWVLQDSVSVLCVFILVNVILCLY